MIEEKTPNELSGTTKKKPPEIIRLEVKLKTKTMFREKKEFLGLVSNGFVPALAT
jgi:hypothetical protein